MGVKPRQSVEQPRPFVDIDPIRLRDVIEPR